MRRITFYSVLLIAVLAACEASRAAWVNETGVSAEADYAAVQFPSSFSGGETSPTIFGRVYEAGLTEAPGPHFAVVAHVGFGPAGTDPRTNSSWQWFPATFNLQIANDDEYAGTVNFPANGTYSYTFRFSVDGGTNFTAADLDGAGSNAGLDFNPALLGTAEVSGVPPQLSIRRTTTNAVVISWNSSSDVNEALYRGTEVTNINTLVTTLPGTNGTREVVQPLSMTNAFFSLQQMPAAFGLVINEVDYDQPGSDLNEFIELYNPTQEFINLAGLGVVLINGANSNEYARVTFTNATLSPGGYLVIANVAVSAAPGTIVFRVPDNFVQNGSPDGIALFDFNRHQLLDALCYEGAMTAANINGEGTFNLVEGTVLPANVADNNTSVGALARIPNGTDTQNASADWRFTSMPTPGSDNVP